MKTVLKKMFCLMLVAVLLVSAVPTAFAAGEDTIPCPRCGETATLVTKNAVPATCTTVQRDIYHCPNTACEYNKDFYNDIEGSELGHDWKAATCDAPKTCNRCGTTEGEKLGHDWAAATCSTKQTCKRCGGSTGETLPHTEAIDAAVPATCSATGLTEGKHCSVCNAVLVAQTEVAKLSHTEAIDAAVPATCTATGLTEGKHCSVCNAVLVAQNTVAALGHNYDANGNCTNGCGTSETDTHEVYFSVNGNQKFWHLGVKHNATVADPGFTYATDYKYLEKNVGDTDTQKFIGWSKNPSATTGSELEYIVQMPVKESVTYYAIYQAKETSNDSNNSGSSNSGSSNSGSSNSGSSSSNIPTGRYSLKVWARVHIGETEEKEILLTTISGLGANAYVVDVMAANKADILAILQSDKFSDYHGIQWPQSYYYHVKDDKYAEVGSTMQVGEEDDVFINLYSAEKLVVVNVHTRKSYSSDLSVRVKGFRVGDIVTYDDVLDAIEKYYNVSSMSIYTYNEMEKVIAGKDANKTYNFKVADSDNVYEVLISGSRKGGTYTYTADSSNPKTGDAIFTPVIVMGASVTALAVLFFLNKKRAVV